jgi:hypothetical protein
MSLLVIAKELWWMDQEGLEIRCGGTIDQKWLPCKAHLVHLPHNGCHVRLTLSTYPTRIKDEGKKFSHH